MNIVDVRGGTKEHKELTEKVVHFCIKELMPKVRTLDIEVSLKNKLDGNVDGYHWHGDSNRQHFIEVSKKLKDDDFTTAIMHEMVHVKQSYRKEIDNTIENEREAYEKQEILLEGWKNDN